mmetsp:Transcript_19079/g.72116  ORF Transcript_19079/g.72116 Transcript_19079/m.72116 type:complete len:840 (+) Transcript_19079:355-2874(+)
MAHELPGAHAVLVPFGRLQVQPLAVRRIEVPPENATSRVQEALEGLLLLCLVGVLAIVFVFVLIVIVIVCKKGDLFFAHFLLLLGLLLSLRRFQICAEVAAPHALESLIGRRPVDLLPWLRLSSVHQVLVHVQLCLLRITVSRIQLQADLFILCISINLRLLVVVDATENVVMHLLLLLPEPDSPRESGQNRLLLRLALTPHIIEDLDHQVLLLEGLAVEGTEVQHRLPDHVVPFQHVPIPQLHMQIRKLHRLRAVAEHHRELHAPVERPLALLRTPVRVCLQRFAALHPDPRVHVCHVLPAEQVLRGHLRRLPEHHANFKLLVRGEADVVRRIRLSFASPHDVHPALQVALRRRRRRRVKRAVLQGLDFPTHALFWVVAEGVLPVLLPALVKPAILEIDHRPTNQVIAEELIPVVDLDVEARRSRELAGELDHLVELGLVDVLEIVLAVVEKVLAELHPQEGIGLSGPAHEGLIQGRQIRRTQHVQADLVLFRLQDGLQNVLFKHWRIVFELQDADQPLEDRRDLPLLAAAGVQVVGLERSGLRKLFPRRDAALQGLPVNHVLGRPFLLEGIIVAEVPKGNAAFELPFSIHRALVLLPKERELLVQVHDCAEDSRAGVIVILGHLHRLGIGRGLGTQWIHNRFESIHLSVFRSELTLAGWGRCRSVCSGLGVARSSGRGHSALSLFLFSAFGSIMAAGVRELVRVHGSRRFGNGFVNLLLLGLNIGVRPRDLVLQLHCALTHDGLHEAAKSRVVREDLDGRSEECVLGQHHFESRQLEEVRVVRLRFPGGVGVRYNLVSSLAADRVHFKADARQLNGHELVGDHVAQADRQDLQPRLA